MDMPMSNGRPSATILRASPQQASRDQQQTTTEDNQEDTSAPPIIKDIIERPPERTSKQTKKSNRTSRFATQKQGFPSVHMPLGTFARRKVRIQSKTTTTKPTALPPTTENSIHQASANDANDMLASMSALEIKEHQQELTAALSPETIAFLKSRKSKTNKPQQETSSTKPVTTKDRSAKERLAQLVSSVKTHSDLDAVYHAELQEAHPLEPTTSTTANNFALACDLLRSNNPRQTLWAAKTVHNELPRRPDEWPLILPVSIRCLLDEPVTRTGPVQGVLHTYLLQSLYQMLLMAVREEHAMDVRKEASPSCSSIYRHYFMDDAVPMPPLDTAYQTTPLKPIQVPQSNHSSATTTAAYATSSSSTSAQSDGEAFVKDPLWTLMAKMRILPRLDALLQHPDLPYHAWLASCGILILLCQRSPGVASAMVHHKTLLPRVLDYTILQPLYVSTDVPWIRYSCSFHCRHSGSQSTGRISRHSHRLHFGTYRSCPFGQNLATAREPRTHDCSIGSTNTRTSHKVFVCDGTVTLEGYHQ